MDNAALNIDELVEQLSGEALSGKMVLLVGDEPQAVSERLGLVTESLIDFGVELVRFDALQLHDADTLRADLCTALDVEPEHLLVGLRIRGQTGNPLLLVVDNSECLAADARRLIAEIARHAEAGLGVVFGGEADAEDALLDSAIPLALVLETHDQPAADDVLTAIPAAAAPLLVPWRHLAAVLGLSLLAWLFWPAGEAPTATVTELSLPPAAVATATPAEAGSAPLQSGVAETQASPDRSMPADVAAVEIVQPAPAEPDTTLTPPPPPPPPAPPPAPQQQVAPEPTVSATRSPPPATRPALDGLEAELGYRHEDWLLAQQGDQWVLQVATASTEDGARILLDQLGRQQSAYYRARRDGRTLFVVLATGWQSREQALGGRQKLSDAMRQRGPFPRQMSTVHGEIIATR